MQTAVYRYIDQNWVETKQLFSDDVAIIIDSDEKVVYIWEGPYSGSRHKAESKAKLAFIRVNYPDYKFRLTRDINPPIVEETLSALLQDTEKLEAKYKRDIKQFEIAVRILLILSITSLGLIIGFLLPKYFNQPTYGSFSSTNMNLVVLFPDNKSASTYFLSLSILGIFSFITTSIAFILSINIKSNHRSILLILVLISEFLLIFVYWAIFIPKLFLFTAQENGAMVFYYGLFNAFLSISLTTIGTSLLLSIFASFMKTIEIEYHTSP